MSIVFTLLHFHILETNYNPNEGTSNVNAKTKAVRFPKDISSTCSEDSETYNQSHPTEPVKAKPKRKYRKSKIGSKYLVHTETTGNVDNNPTNGNGQGINIIKF